MSKEGGINRDSIITDADIESVEEDDTLDDTGNKSNDLSAHDGKRFLGIMKDNSYVSNSSLKYQNNGL